jgi:hypothetical protein
MAMSFVTVAADAVAEAAKTLQGIGSGLSAATTAAATPTTGIAAAAQDEVSAAIAGLMGNFGQEFQAINTQMQAFHDRFISTLSATIGQYANAEATNVQQVLLNAVNGPAEAMFGFPLIGTGAAVGVNPTASVAAAAASFGGTPFSFPVFNYPTPLGPIAMTVYGEQSIFGTITVTSGSLVAPPLLALAYDLGSPAAIALTAFRDGGTAFTSAVQAGDAVAAGTALIQTPVNAVTGFFIGQEEITGSMTLPSYSGYAGVDYRLPVGGLFAPLQPVTLTLHGSDGTVTALPLSGTQFGGLFPAIADALMSLSF